MALRLWLYVAVAFASYHLTALIQTSLHRALGHRSIGGALHTTHVGEHHAIYPAEALVAERYSDQRDASKYYIVPGALIVLASYAALPIDVFAVHVGTLALSSAAHAYVHVQYHLRDPWLGRFRWFQRRRHLHFVHHQDLTKNFAVLEFVWDRLFGTYAPARP
jgi:sterol desaturase/sphingolipid hydroxylase (fatty acid hydroxylase superfamily)